MSIHHTASFWNVPGQLLFEQFLLVAGGVSYVENPNDPFFFLAVINAVVAHRKTAQSLPQVCTAATEAGVPGKQRKLVREEVQEAAGGLGTLFLGDVVQISSKSATALRAMRSLLIRGCRSCPLR